MARKTIWEYYLAILVPTEVINDSLPNANSLYKAFHFFSNFFEVLSLFFASLGPESPGAPWQTSMEPKPGLVKVD